MGQRHLGGGDNVGRDKITHIKFPFKPVFVLIIVSIATIFGYKNQDLISHALGWDKVFQVKETRFKILIIPFKVMCDYNRNKDIGLHITERLVELNLKDTLNIFPYYLDIPISNNFDSDSAKYLQEYHNADQIIYGSYFDQDCSESDGDEVCYNWYTDEKWDIDSLYQENSFTSSNYRIATIQDLRKGKIQGSTDYIIYWIAGLNAYNQIQYSKALEHWSYIYFELNIVNSSLLRRLGDVAAKLADYQNALKYYGECLLLSHTQQDSAAVFNNLASVYKDLGDYERARDLLRAALESDIRNFGEEHSYTAIKRSNLALVYKNLGDYEQARDLLQTALESYIRNFGEEHPATAISRSNLALVYQDLGDYEQARDLLRAALESAISNFGEAHPTTAISRSNLALVYQDLGDYQQARDLLHAALESDLRNFGGAHPSTAISRSNLATVYQDLGDYEQAQDLLQAALESAIRNFGEEHPATARRRSNLALVYQDLGDYEQARDLLRVALESDIRNFGEEHPATAKRRSNLATVYKDLGEYEQAQELFQKAYYTFKSLLGENHPDTKNAKRWLDSVQ